MFRLMLNSARRDGPFHVFRNIHMEFLILSSYTVSKLNSLLWCFIRVSGCRCIFLFCAVCIYEFSIKQWEGIRFVYNVCLQHMPAYIGRYKSTCVASNRGKDDISCMTWCILIRLIFLFFYCVIKEKTSFLCVSSSRIKRCSVTSAIICWEPFFCSSTTHTYITTKKTNNFYNITHPLHHTIHKSSWSTTHRYIDTILSISIPSIPNQNSTHENIQCLMLQSMKTPLFFLIKKQLTFLLCNLIKFLLFRCVCCTQVARSPK